MYDFNILSGYLDDDDRKQVFEKLAQSGEGRACIDTALSFFYTGVSDLSPDDSGTLEVFESLLEVGIHRAESEKGVILDVNVDIDIDREELDPDFLLDKVLANEATLPQYYALPQEQSVELLEKVIEQDEPHTLSFESSREEDGLEFTITPDNARENLKRISDTEEGDDTTSN
jgi:hypothetical protein